MKKFLLWSLSMAAAVTTMYAYSPSGRTDSGTSAVTVKWAFADDEGQGRKDAYREFALINDATGDFTAIGSGHATYKNRTEEDRYVLHVAPGKYHCVMAFDMSVNNSKSKVKYVIAENVIIGGDTTLLFDAATATRSIAFRPTTPGGERIRVPEMNGGKMVFDSINAKMLIECRFLYRKNSAYMKGDVKQHPYDNVKAALRPGEFSDVLVNPGVSSDFVFGFAAQYSKSEPRYGSSDFSEGTSDVMITLAAAADSPDTIMRPALGRFIEFIPKHPVKTPYEGTSAKYPTYVRHAVTFRNSGAVMSMFQIANKSEEGAFFICNNNPDLLVDVFSVNWAEASATMPNCANPAGILSPWAIVEPYGVCSYVMPNNAPDGFNLPYRDRKHTNMYLNFTEGHPFFAYTSSDVTPDFGTTAPVLSFMACDNEVTRTNATYAMSQNVSPHFIGNCGEDRNIDAHAATWSIYADTTAIYTGPFSAAFRTALTNHYKQAHAAHRMRIVMDNRNFRIDDMQGHHHAEMTYNENAADVVPPTITNWRLRDRNGKLSNRFVLDKATITFSFTDLAMDTTTKAGLLRLHCDAKVECAPHGTTAFREIPTREIDNLYDEFYGWLRQGELSAATVGAPVKGWYDLRFTVTDGAGNSQVQTVSPAFYAKWDTGAVTGADADGVRIAVDGRRITVYGVADATLFDIEGRCVASASGDGGTVFTAPCAGIYLLRADGRTFKVSVR